MLTFILGAVVGLLASRTAVATTIYNKAAEKLTFLPR
jgi:hypothetical protein